MGMSATAFVRRNPEAAAMVAVLEEAGVSWDISQAGKHAKLIYVAHGRRFTHPISRTPSDHRAAKNAAGYVRKVLRQPAPLSERARP